MVFVYLDDLLILAPTRLQAEKAIAQVLKDLLEAGMQVNHPKSVLIPTQKLSHLGFSLDLETGFLSVPPQKIKALRKDLGKF